MIGSVVSDICHFQPLTRESLPTQTGTTMQTSCLVVFILVALGFDSTNGFHAAANTVAVPITTRTLAQLMAPGIAAALNVVGALVSTKVAVTVGGGIVATPQDTHGLVVIFATLIGAITSNLITWWLGLPSSRPRRH
jgi:phosphate/sulfate permease